MNKVGSTVCLERISALPMLTYQKYAVRRFSKNALFIGGIATFFTTKGTI